jgi:hypothetical protein
MVERRQRRAEVAVEVADPGDDLRQYDRYKGMLVLDVTDLDGELSRQAEYYFHVAEHASNAEAERDAVKLELDELEADTDGVLRDRAAKMEAKVTEASMRQQLRLDPAIQKKERELLRLKAVVGRWGALKEAFFMRGAALRKLTDSVISHRMDLAAEAGAGQSRSGLADQTRAIAGRLRRAASVERSERTDGDS